MAALRLVCAATRKRFARVPMMSTDQLLEIMKLENPSRHLVLLDVREEEEFRVSHIPGAINVSPSTKDMQGIITEINEKGGGPEQLKTVVAYCSVGYRSSSLTQQLMEHLENVEQGNGKLVDLFNLEGSIFKWAIEGKELVQPSTHKKTTVVHPYSEVWGKILDPNMRSYRPKDGEPEINNLRLRGVVGTPI